MILVEKKYICKNDVNGPRDGVNGINLELLHSSGNSDHNLEGKNVALKRQVMFQVERRLYRQAIKTNVRDSNVSM